MATYAQAPTAQAVGMMAGDGSIPDGALFGLPGVTIQSEQKENNAATVATPSAAAQVPVNFAANFKQTDIVFFWRMRFALTMGSAPTGTGLALSPYFPYNMIGPMSLNLQNQFDSISYFSGYDAALFQMVRPVRETSWPANFMDQMTGAVATNAYNDAANFTTASNYTTSSTSISFDVDLTPGIWFDLYYDLEQNGMLLNTKAQGIRTFVSPQMMAGTNRIVQPRVTYNQFGGLSTATNDVSGYPYTVTSSVVVLTTPSAQLDFRRKITYQPQSSKDAPLLWNWQYSRQTVRNTPGASSSWTIPLPLVGQILSFWISFRDPSQSNTSQVIDLNANVTELDVQIGSGLFRFQDTPEDMQLRFWRQHGTRPPKGVAVWDMALDEMGRITNANCINTLTTSAPQITVTFSSTPGSSAYYILGYEALRYVALQ